MCTRVRVNVCVCVPSYLNENELLGEYRTCMEQPLAIAVMNPTKGDHSNFWSCLINLALTSKSLGCIFNTVHHKSNKCIGST